MSYIDYFGLSLSIMLLGISPGPAAFAIISRSLSDGFKKSLFIIYGIMFAHIIYVLVTIFGLEYISNEFKQFFILVKYMSIVYLLYLSYKLWNKKMKHKDDEHNQVSNKMNFLAGSMIAFSNPKAIVFYLGFLPAFMDLNNLLLKEIVYITIIIPISLASVLILYAYVAARAKKMMQNDSSILLLNRISSIVMFIVALILIFTN